MQIICFLVPPVMSIPAVTVCFPISLLFPVNDVRALNWGVPFLNQDTPSEGTTPSVVDTIHLTALTSADAGACKDKHRDLLCHTVQTLGAAGPHIVTLVVPLL